MSESQQEQINRSVERASEIRKLVLAIPFESTNDEPVLLKVLKKPSARGVLGQELDVQFILAGLITDPENIVSGGKYVMTPCDSRDNVARQVQQVLEKLRECGEHSRSNEPIDLIIPVCEPGHWVLVTVTIENKKITAIEHSNSLGGPSETPVEQRTKKNSECTRVLGGLFAKVNSEDFAETFIVNTIKRNEQGANMYCMDYTIQAALRKLGKELYNPNTGISYYDLAYRSGSGTHTNEENLRQSTVNIMQARLENQQVLLRNCTREQLDKYNRAFADCIKPVKPITHIRPINRNTSSRTTVKNTSIFSVFFSVVWFILTLPVNFIKWSFQLGHYCVDSLLDIVFPPKNLTTMVKSEFQYPIVSPQIATSVMPEMIKYSQQASAFKKPIVSGNERSPSPLPKLK